MARQVVRDIKSSLSFDGSGDYVTFPFVMPSSGSISVWVKLHRLFDFNGLWDTTGTGSDVNRWEAWIYAAGGVGARTHSLLVAGAANTPANVKPLMGTWVHIVHTYAASGNATIYINGEQKGNIVATTGGVSGTDFNWGTNQAGNSDSDMNMSDGRIYNVELTAAEVATLYNTGKVPYTPQVWHKFDEGAGTTATDSSGNGNIGTISGSAAFSADTPSRSRQLVGNNLVRNGDMEYVPPFTAATTADDRWIDGTAGGSTTNDLFKWAVNKGGTVAGSFDTVEKNTGSYSLKLSTTAIASFIEARQTVSLSVANINLYGIPVTPGVAYTVSYYMKTTAGSGDSSDGAFLTVNEYSATSTSTTASTNGTKVKTTTGWTLYTVSFTANASTRFVQIVPKIDGSTGTATLIMDAYFDDISLVETTPVGRGGVQDYKASLLFNGSTSKVASGSAIATSSTMSATFWVRRIGIGSTGAVPRIVSVAGGVQKFEIGLGSDGSGSSPSGVISFGAWLSSGYKIQNGVWYRVAAVANGTSNKLYINGQNVFSGTNTTVSTSTGVVTLGSAGSSDWLNSQLASVQVYGRALTDAEIALDASSGIIPASPLVSYQLGEGAGTTANDTSGSANHGTITAATYSADVPTKKRLLVGGNMVTNGDFEYAPPFTAATTAANWVDGTAAGSATNALFGWAVQLPAGSGSVRFDPSNAYSGAYGLKVSTTAIASNVLATVRQSPAGLGYRVEPNVSYSYSFMMKTNLVSGDSNDGAWIAWKERNAAGSNIATTNSTKVKITSVWTQYTGTFTTAATTYYIDPQPTVKGDTGTATLLLDGYFDDIVLRPTTNTTRTAVS